MIQLQVVLWMTVNSGKAQAILCPIAPGLEGSDTVGRAISEPRLG
jgi:hypothetical protein